MADADHAYTQGLDGTEVCGRQAGGEYMARAPGAVCRTAREARPPAPAGRVDAQLQARRTVRREGRVPRGVGGYSSQGPAADGHECPLQWRPVAGAAQ